MDCPTAASLRRCWPWQDRDLSGPALPRTAHHEGGHIAVMRWLGIEGMTAEASEQGGQAVLPPGLLDSLGEPGPDESGLLTATAAAIFHAGFEAERLMRGEPWQGPTWAPKQPDFQVAEAMLAPKFGRLSSAAHGYAARLARSVLVERWAEVEQVAQVLIERGRWSDQEGAEA